MKAQKKRTATKTADIESNRSIASIGAHSSDGLRAVRQAQTTVSARPGASGFPLIRGQTSFQFDHRSQRYRAGHGNEGEVRRFL